jgi:hypothetical protein
MNPDTERRVLMALDQMIRSQQGIHSAARAAHTTARTIKAYALSKGIKLIKMAKGQYRVGRTPQQKIKDLILAMHSGKSATASCRALHTTVGTMSKQTLDYQGTPYPIIQKQGSHWKTTFLPVFDYSVVLYGKLLAMGDKVQGAGSQAGPKAKQSQTDPNYADIWWQIDFNNFESSLNATTVAEFWKPAIMQQLRSELEAHNITDPMLSGKFLGNAQVSADAQSKNRVSGGSMQLSSLEKMMNRYDIRMDGKVNAGVDDNLTPRDPDFILLSDVTSGTAGAYQSQGLFQVMVMRRSGVATYPVSGPKPVNFSYDLNDELV